MHLKRPTERNFDSWLTTIPDEELQLLSRITNQAFTDHAKPSETLTHILALVLHFYGQPASVAAINAMLHRFAMNLALETLRRQGDITKEGAYSIAHEYDDAAFIWTEQGKAKLLQGDT